MTAPASGRMSFVPAPGAATAPAMLAAQTRMELRLLLRNGEQVGLTLVIPLLLEFFLNLPLLYSLDAPRRIDFVVPSVLALAVMSASFTGLAIATGFERKYAVLKRLGATALSRPVLLLAKTGAVLILQMLQACLIAGFGLVLGWHPTGNAVWAVLLIVLGTAAFGGLGLLLAGTVRAEITLAAANLVWLLLLFAGGIAIPLARYPSAAAGVLRFLPSAALSDGLHQAIRPAGGLPVQAVLTLLVWAGLALPAAARWFRWE